MDEAVRGIDYPHRYGYVEARFSTAWGVWTATSEAILEKVARLCKAIAGQDSSAFLTNFNFC